MSNDFNDFLMNRQKESTNPENRGTESKSEHKTVLLRFYETIKEWLEKTEQEGLVTFQEKIIFDEITELGLQFGNDEIIIKPEHRDYKNNSFIKVNLVNVEKDLSSVELTYNAGLWYIQDNPRIGFNFNGQLNEAEFKNLLKKLLG